MVLHEVPGCSVDNVRDESGFVYLVILTMKLLQSCVRFSYEVRSRVAILKSMSRLRMGAGAERVR